ncbi:hypothetical protein Zmor_012743 [Zophobas morio]|uniref:THAP-type domain-containing protein n=1 Tax=Zophobas morio TaxID=2755281 RepID=A0AA38IE45_9CUCU|nr:hypothetical protein Zmor_012743 [Zophobas morio]
MSVELAERCAVPNCDNTASTGIPFPKQTETLEKWLQSLKIPDFTPTPRSFVCLNHFGSDDILERIADADIEHVLEHIPIPTLPESKIDLTKNTITSTKSYDTPEAVFVEASVCRLCMNEGAEEHVFGIYEDVVISNLINICIPPIKILKRDGLSKWICKNCAETLYKFYQFRNTCIEIDKRQKNMLKISLKRKHEDELAANDLKKNCVELQEDIVNLQSLTTQPSIKVVDAELMKALEEKIPEEMRCAENIIIEVQSDDESDQSQEILNVLSDDNVVMVGEKEVRLPRGIKVKSSQTQLRSELRYVQLVQEVENTEFCLIDNYLFEYRLCKGDIRHLKCIVTKCKATAQQTMTKTGVYDSNVWLKDDHNHPAPSVDDRKKQMFLHMMRRKMQYDKSLNFRNVYEEFCEKDPEIKKLVPLKTVINQICSQQMNLKLPPIESFQHFFDIIENDELQKLHFTHTNAQFYQEKFASSDGSQAVVFANCETIEKISDSRIMYVDASFKIDTPEAFKYHLVSVLVWLTDSYYPIMFALINEKSQEIYKMIFSYLHDTLAPNLRPVEIVTDYEASLYYSLGEVYLDSHIGGSVFYYTQNLYKKICSLNLSRELETNSCFRNIYHMILMLPLLPVNTIVDGFNNIQQQAVEMGLGELTKPIFDHVKSQWIDRVTPDLFCVHRLENRINENVIAPFKKLRDFIMLSKGKMLKQYINIISIVEKLIELESFLSVVYSAPSKKSFARDLSSSQKKNVIRAWQFIESHPKININNFFTKVLGYIKCMENQLWIWGFYRYSGEANDELINAANFSIVNTTSDDNDDHNYDQHHQYVNYAYPEDEVVVDVVIDQKNGFLIKDTEMREQMQLQTQNSYME